VETQQDVTGPSAYFFAYLGAAIALVFANLGSAYGTAKAGVGVMSMGVNHSQLVMKATVPCIMAGIFGIYGLIVAVILSGGVESSSNFTYAKGYKTLASGLCCGFSSLGAGMAVGIVGDAGVRAFGQQEKLFVGMLLILIFAEAIGLFGFIVSLVLAQ
jgi:V-type H+-transporting ATPase proteolipid subunit